MVMSNRTLVTLRCNSFHGNAKKLLRKTNTTLAVQCESSKDRVKVYEVTKTQNSGLNSQANTIVKNVEKIWTQDKQLSNIVIKRYQ